MWFIIILCVLLCVIIGFFVLEPLMSTNSDKLNTNLNAQGFTDENELRQTLLIRDSLFAKLINGSSNTETINQLSESDALDALISVCERLRRFDFPIFPNVTKFIWLMMIVPLFSSALLASSNGQAQGRMSIPELYTDPTSGLKFATLNQFLISPRQGSVQVFYLGVFLNSSAETSTQVALPFPADFTDFKLANQEGLVQASANTFPIVSVPLKAGVNELRAEFTLDAPTGVIEWHNSGIPKTPGTQLYLMPEYQSALRNMLEGVFPSFNLWPARIVDAPTDFTSDRTQEEHNPADPNFAMLSKMPPEYTRNLVRTSAQPAAFPSFKIVGVVPSRVPLYSLGALFAAFLFGTASFTLVRSPKQNSRG